jgi:hypothetical protein
MTDEEIIAALKSGETVNYGVHGRNMEVISLIDGLLWEGLVKVEDVSSSQETRYAARWVGEKQDG